MSWQRFRRDVISGAVGAAIVEVARRPRARRAVGRGLAAAGAAAARAGGAGAIALGRFAIRNPVAALAIGDIISRRLTGKSLVDQEFIPAPSAFGLPQTVPVGEFISPSEAAGVFATDVLPTAAFGVAVLVEAARGKTGISEARESLGTRINPFTGRPFGQ